MALAKQGKNKKPKVKSMLKIIDTWNDLTQMNSHFPLVSVILPAYNAEAFIGQTLAAVLAQTYRNIEVLVVDDGSGDRTAEIVESIAQKDHRVILLRQSNTGVAAARNLAIQNSRGEYIAPIDADDIWYPQKLEKQVQCMSQAEPSVGLVYAWTAHIDEKNLPTGVYDAYNLEGWVYTALVYSNFVGNASVPLISRTCLKQVGSYNCELKEHNAQGCEDWDLYLRIAECYQFRVVPELLIGYRQIISSMSCNHTSMEKSYHLVMTDVQQRHPEIPTTIYRWSSSFFYTYLLGKSLKSGNYWSTLVCLYKALKLDFAVFSNPGLYKVFFVSLLKLAAKPVLSLIWKDHRSWLQFRQRFRSAHQAITISDINREINKPQRLPWKPYDRVLLQRWYRIVQSCRTVSP